MSKMTDLEFFQNILDKVAYIPPQGAPPMDPAMAQGMPPQGMPPMDPAMAQGMPPQGAPPMDPAMAQGMPPQGMPPMGPAMAQGMPPQGGAAADPVEMLLQVLMGIDEKLDVLLERKGGEDGGRKEPTSAEIVEEGLSTAAEDAGLASMARGAAPSARM